MSIVKKVKNKELILGLSPMDGVTDCAYREMCKVHGNADLIYTEFQNVHGMCLGAERIFEHFEYTENQRIILAQIYGQEVEYYYPAAMLCFLIGFDGVDINMGCPAKKISDRGAGAGLIRFPLTAQAIIQEVKRARKDFQLMLSSSPPYQGGVAPREVSAGVVKPEREISDSDLIYFLKSQLPYNPTVNTWESLQIKWEKLIRICKELTEKWEVNSIFNGKVSQQFVNELTVSVKTRIGYDTPILQKWILEVLSQDIDFLAIHGRTLKQMYTGSADWEEIGRGIQTARENGYTLPIFANGDIKTVDDAMRCLQITKADGLLVGRGTYGDPELMSEIKKTENKINPNISNVLLPLKADSVVRIEDLRGLGGVLITPAEPKTLTSQKINLILEHCTYFEKFKGPDQFFQMRKVLGWYISGIDNAVEIRKELYQSNSKAEVEKILAKYS